MERVRNRRSAVSACRPGCSASGHAGGQDLRKVVRCSSCPCSRHPHYAAGAEVSALTVQDAAPKQKGPTAVGPFCFRERYCVLTIMLRMRLVMPVYGGYSREIGRASCRERVWQYV